MKLFKSGSSKEESFSETKKCPDCLADIPKEAKKCSHCGSKQKAQLTKRQVVGVFVVIILFIVFIVSISGGDSSSTPTAQQPEITDTKAHVIAQNYVEMILKAPSTADFPTYDYQAFDLGDDKYKIVSYVDAQNSFGAMVRSDYSVILSYNGSGQWADKRNWTVHELIFDGEIMFEESSSEE